MERSQATTERTFAPLAPRQLAALALLGFICLGGLLADRLLHACWSAPLVDVERTQGVPCQLQIDVNQADWPELTVLPQIGEALAKRIVERRERVGRYVRATDLLEVRGIGPKTLTKIEPWLVPLDGPAPPAAGLPPRRAAAP